MQSPSPAQHHGSAGSANAYGLLTGEGSGDEEDLSLCWSAWPGGGAGTPPDCTAGSGWPAGADAGAFSAEYTAGDETAALEAAIAVSLADAGGGAVAGHGDFGWSHEAQLAAEAAAAAGEQPGHGWVLSQAEAASPAAVWACEPAQEVPALVVPSPSTPDGNGESDEGFAADLGAALRAQQEQLQRQWQQAAAAGPQGEVWAEPTPAPLPASEWQEPVKAAFPAAEQDDTTVDDLLALMGIA